MSVSLSVILCIALNNIMLPQIDLRKPAFGLFPEKAKRAEQGLCTNEPCDSEIKSTGDFRDGISIDEYGISGLCQKCQDEVFGDRSEW